MLFKKVFGNQFKNFLQQTPKFVYFFPLLLDFLKKGEIISYQLHNLMLDLTRIVRFSRNLPLVRYFPVAVSKSNFHKGPWNVLYFGTDQFAVWPLDSLNRC